MPNKKVIFFNDPPKSRVMLFPHYDNLLQEKVKEEKK